MTDRTDQPAPIDDPAVRAKLATMYMQKSREQRDRYGWTLADTADGRLLYIAANWESVRNRLAYLVALNLITADGTVQSSFNHWGRDFAAAQILADRSMDRWRAAWRASKQEVSR